MKTMHIILFILFCFSFKSIYSQVPLAIPYQAVARDNSGNILANQTISLRFSIIDNHLTGPVLYSETHSVTTNGLGLFSLSIGLGNASTTTGPFDPTKWKILATFIKTEIDITGGSTYIEMGTTQILSVPFAAYAEKSGKAFGAVNYAGTWDASSTSPPATSSPDIKGDYYVVSVAGSMDLDGIDDWGIGDWAIFNGTVWEKVDNSQTIIDGENVSFTPNSVITSTNVQGAIEELNINLDSKKVNRAGDVMTGDLILNADPTTSLGAVTKQYVDVGDVALQSQFSSLIDSYIHLVDDGVSIYLPPGGTRKRFGIGDTQPDAPLGIKAEAGDERLISLRSSDAGNNQNWLFGLRSLNSDSAGLNIEDASSGTGVSRFFIQESSGFIGLGTTSPSEKLEINDNVADGIAGLKILNTAVSSHQGWKLGHLHDPSDTKKDRALIFSEPVSFSPGSGITRLTVLSGGNVGINEVLPDVKLHVSRPLSDPQTNIDLIEGTGILVLGPITDNIVADYRGIQARHGEYIADVLQLSSSTLNLQRLGGEILIHGDDNVSLSSKGIITTDAKIGLGTITPAEKIDIDGAIKIGMSSASNEGTIRWTGSDFEGRRGGTWLSLSGIDSYLHRTDDGVRIYLPPGGTRKRFGIGDTQPGAPLGILAESNGERAISIKSSDTYNSGNNQNWFFGLRSLNADSAGLNIEDASSGTGVSRFFIKGSTGYIGIGTISPEEKLEINDSVPDGAVRLKIRNKASVSNSGWMLSHIHENIEVERDGALDIVFADPSGSASSGKLTILKTGNVGINETLPYATLHVNRPVSDPQSDVSLNLGSGIMMVGQADGHNLVLDNHQIQAREYNPTLSYLVGDASILGLQPRGGDILVHGSASIEKRIIITDSGFIGIGTITPSAQLDVSGKFKIGNDAPVISGSSISGLIINKSQTTSGGQDDNRIGLQISTSLPWSTEASAKNIGLLVSEVIGQTPNQSNLAAVLNGNTVIGNISSSSVIGNNGMNVLAIQNGVSPSTQAGSSVLTNGGIQIYSVSGADGTSVFHLMNGDGTVIKLYRAAALTPADNSAVSSTTYGTTEADVINNLRNRINELESKLQALGLLN